MMEGGFGASDNVMNRKPFVLPYFLVDGIYPSWECFVKGRSQPFTEREKLFSKKIAAFRKDVERAFGILKKRFHSLKRPC